MKKYKFQNRSQKKSQSCVPLRYSKEFGRKQRLTSEKFETIVKTTFQRAAKIRGKTELLVLVYCTFYVNPMNSRGYLPNLPPRPPESHASVCLFLSILVGSPIPAPLDTVDKLPAGLDGAADPLPEDQTGVHGAEFVVENCPVRQRRSTDGNHATHHVPVSQEMCCQLFSRFFGRALQKNSAAEKQSSSLVKTIFFDTALRTNNDGMCDKNFLGPSDLRKTTPKCSDPPFRPFRKSIFLKFGPIFVGRS